MARDTGLYTKGKAFNNSSAPMSDISKNQGYDGHLPDISAYVTNGAYVRRNLVAKLMSSPKGFDLLRDAKVWHSALKSIIETQSKTISGITSTLALEYSENNISGGGEVQSDIANVTRTPSTPTHGVLEKPGKPISKFWEGWILNLLMDPETKVPRVMYYKENVGKNIDLLPDMIGCAVLYFEPDHTFSHVLEAWLCIDMKPKNGLAVEGSRDLAAGGTNLEHSLEFTSIQQVGTPIMALAQAKLDEMNLGGVNPNLRPAVIDKVSGTVADSESGYAEGIKAAQEAFKAENV